jgi:hypothetical protein
VGLSGLLIIPRSCSDAQWSRIYRLPNDAVAGVEADVAPHCGSSSAFSALAARGKIVDEAPDSVKLPLGYKLPQPSRGDSYICVVRIDEVVAGPLKVPTVKNGNKQATLREFGSTPFNIILPGSMLRLERDNRRELADATTYESVEKVLER